MPVLSPTQARLVDPVLTGIAQGYKQLDFIGNLLFPTVQVGQRAGKIITFGREDFMLYASERAPGENTKRVGFGYAGNPFALIDYSLEGALPIETNQETSSPDKGYTIDMARMTMMKTMDIMALRLEYQQAQLARNLANYSSTNKVTLTGTSQWSDYSGTSNPIKDIETAKEAIRAKTGKRPNLLIIPAAVMPVLRQHPVIVDRMKYTTTNVADASFLAGLFGVRNVVMGEGIFANDAGVFSDIWGKDVILAFTETASLASMGTPTFGYTYQLRGYPLAETPYYDNNAKSWYFPVSRCEAPVIAAQDAGYLIKNSVA